MSIKIENIEVFNFEGAIRGLRNPMNSWSKSDSFYCYERDCLECPYAQFESKDTEDEEIICNDPMLKCTLLANSDYTIGPKDIELCQRMISAGSSDSKFMRQIFVSIDITAPTYWCAELDTYKVSTVRNSCSFMHKGTSKEFDIGDFSTDNMSEFGLETLDYTIRHLNMLRDKYLETKDQSVFLEIRKLLPMSYNYRFTWTANYEVLRNIYFQRKSHRLPEWREFCKMMEEMPYGKEFICYEKQGLNHGN